MVKTLSTMLPLGTTAPDFSLTDAHGETHSLKPLTKDAKGTVVAFICNHCPYVKLLKEAFATFAKEYQKKGIVTIAINSNDVENYPDDSPEKMTEDSQTFDYTFPYLIDDSQEVAKTYKAACTPDFYVFDSELSLVYRGQFDDSRPGNGVTPDGADLRKTLNALLSNTAIDANQKPSLGCNIKWKEGNEPDFFKVSS